MRASKLVSAVAVAVAASFAGSHGASAADSITVDGPTFAAQYCQNGSFTLQGSLTVRGGTADLPDPHGCTVQMTDGATLKLVRTKVQSDQPDANFSVTGDAINASFRMFRSKLSVPNVVMIQPGYPNSNGGSVKIVRSKVSGADVYVLASQCGDNGKVVVKRSQITSTYNGGLLELAASVGPQSPCTSANSGGRVNVSRSKLTTNMGNLIVDTGADGRTSVRKTQLDSPQRHIHSDGRCISRGNRPNTPCE